MSVQNENINEDLKEEPKLTEEQKQEIANEWKEEHENILTEWAEKAMCYRWLHHRSHMSYRRKNAFYTIPVIVISTLTGTANFALDRFSESAKHWAVMVIGALNISAGIISTVSQFLKISEINEGHRVASIAWDKFYRNVKLELNKAPKERRHPNETLKLSKEEYDRLIETSPMIQDDIIKLFKRSFDFNRLKTELSLPEILDDLEHVGKYDRSKDAIVPQLPTKYEIRNEDIIDKLKEVIGENNSNPINPLNIEDVSRKIKNKLQKEIEMTGGKRKKKKTVKQKENNDFVIELKPQVKSRNREQYIQSPPPTTRTTMGLTTAPSFMIGAHAAHINEMEDTSSESEASGGSSRASFNETLHMNDNGNANENINGNANEEV